MNNIKWNNTWRPSENKEMDEKLNNTKFCISNPVFYVFLLKFY